MMNPNAQKLYDWLMSGAPHAVFDMNYDMNRLESMSETYQENIPPEKHDCGTVCCIGGAAYQMSTTPDGSFPDEMPKSPSGMFETLLIGGQWLGLKKNANRREFYHNLFDPGQAPDGCTPQRAAAALKAACEGADDPWEAI